MIIRINNAGSDFLKEGVRGTGPVVENIMDGVQNELQIMAFVISKHADNFLNLIKKAVERGVKTTVVINKLSEQDAKVIEQLGSLAREYNHFKLVDFNRRGKTLHAKVVVVDREKAVIGSANFSWGGMSGNYEIGILVEGKEAYTLGKLVDDVAFSRET